MYSLFIFHDAKWATALLVATGLCGSGCAKEKVVCGHPMPIAGYRFQIIDDRTGLDWFEPAGRPLLDSIKRWNNQRDFYISKIDKQVVWSGFGFGASYKLPTSGGDLTNSYIIRVGPTDTDTIETRTHFGPLTKIECSPTLNYVESVEFRYNSRLNSSYGNNPNSAHAQFYCNGCGTIMVFRKRP